MDSFHHAMPRMLSLEGTLVGTGWLPSAPDMNDYRVDYPHDAVAQAFGLLAATEKVLPERVDLSAHCSVVETQGPIGSCTAHAVTSTVEYFGTRVHGENMQASRLFVYKMARWLAGLEGDTGAYLRHAMAALKLFGVPPEKYWPYTTNRDKERGRTFDGMPEAPVFALADNFEGLKYVRHDAGTRDALTCLNSMKKYLACGVPSVLGFYGFSSIQQGDPVGGIPFPGPGERAIFAHAVMIVGYDDDQIVRGNTEKSMTKGALRVLNSWGPGWGDGGFGWLPYKYIETRLAQDIWSLIKMEWAESREFGL